MTIIIVTGLVDLVARKFDAAFCLTVYRFFPECMSVNRWKRIIQGGMVSRRNYALPDTINFVVNMYRLSQRPFTIVLF